MAERFNVHHEVRQILDADEATALSILPGLAGDILAAGDAVQIEDLKLVLSFAVLERGPNHVIAEAVLAMVRSYAMHKAAHFAF